MQQHLCVVGCGAAGEPSLDLDALVSEHLLEDRGKVRGRIADRAPVADALGVSGHGALEGEAGRVLGDLALHLDHPPRAVAAGGQLVVDLDVAHGRCLEHHPGRRSHLGPGPDHHHGRVHVQRER